MRPKRSAAPPTASPCTSSRRIALPRRFSLPMQEIWLLQSRFAQRQRKRVFRLLAHPRFRAAFDFLVAAPGGLRASTPKTSRSGARRRRQPGDALRRAAGCAAARPKRREDGDAPRKRRRRRRERRHRRRMSDAGATPGRVRRPGRQPRRRVATLRAALRALDALPRHAAGARLAPVPHAGVGRDRAAGLHQRGRRCCETRLHAARAARPTARRSSATPAATGGRRQRPLGAAHARPRPAAVRRRPASTNPACTCRIRTCTSAPSCWCRWSKSPRTRAFPASGPRRRRWPDGNVEVEAVAYADPHDSA